MEESERQPLRVLLIGVGCTLVAYALSIGPSYRLLRKGSIGQQTFSSAYSPILLLSDHSQPFFRAMDWYCTLWYSDGRELSRWLHELKSKNE
jgi:hypothetical protein